MQSSNTTARTTALAAIAALLLVGAGCAASSSVNVRGGEGAAGAGTRPPEAGEPAMPPKPGNDQAVPPSPGAAGANVQLGVNAGASLGEVHEVMITAKQFSFDPAEIRVKKGERVRLVAKSVDATHGIAIPAFNVNMTIEPGQAVTAEFVADKAGTYPFFCSVFCGSGHGSMKGTLIVE